jgi:hypothetical protein
LFRSAILSLFCFLLAAIFSAFFALELKNQEANLLPRPPPIPIKAPIPVAKAS